MQYYGLGWVKIAITLTFAFFILFNIWRSKKSSGSLFIRRISGLNAIDDAVGRATEMGRPVLMVPGLGGLNAIAVQALNVFAHVTNICCKFGTPIRVCCGEPAVYAVAQEVIRDVYVKEQQADKFHPEFVQFLSNQQFAFAAGVAGMIHREKVAATFLLGEFFAESLIFAESANAEGAIQIAGTTRTTQTPFFIAACDYVLIGDEYYAASAYLSREPVLVGSLVGQDWVKIGSVALVLVGSILNSFQMSQKVTTEWKDGVLTEGAPEHYRTKAESTMDLIFDPQKMPKSEIEAVTREKDPNAKKPEEAPK
ncbi:MAG: hypothetical protein K8R88_11800 [Armatimonadetes bacterium]|nr:hypothetical protein [Armatimonadota bacterium]